MTSPARRGPHLSPRPGPTDPTRCPSVAASRAGRMTKKILTSDPQNVYTDTTYDNLGRVASVSNFYRTTGDPTYGITSYHYDPLGPVVKVTQPDGQTVLTTYTNRATQVQDEGNGTSRVTKVYQSDAQGRLLSVCEVTSVAQLGSGGTPAACNLDISATGFLTTYGYDTLDNLN